MVASDECYLALSAPPDRALSILHPDVCDDYHGGLLAVHSMSKSSNLAGYRAGFVTGDPELVADLLEVRKHAGMMVPRPVQAAMAAAACDDAHVVAQAETYARAGPLRPALEAGGLTVSSTRRPGSTCGPPPGEHGRRTVRRLAELGILVGAGEFYGPAGERHVRLALDERRPADRPAVDRATSLIPPRRSPPRTAGWPEWGGSGA